ncbi:MAG: hypothetical protein ACM3L5_00605 [Candidatus Saccharibacteria bacterium]
MTTQQRAEYRAHGSYSRAGLYLSLIGGGLIILQGLIAVFFSSIYYAIITSSLGVGISVVFLGIMLIILGIIVYSSAYGLTRAPDQHVLTGASIVIFSLLALFLGGGYIIGSVMGIIGGIIAIVSRG